MLVEGAAIPARSMPWVRSHSRHHSIGELGSFTFLVSSG